jgi:hypothetical protein
LVVVLDKGSLKYTQSNGASSYDMLG